MLKKPRQRTWDDVLGELRRLQFDVQPVSGDANQQRISKESKIENPDLSCSRMSDRRTTTVRK